MTIAGSPPVVAVARTSTVDDGFWLRLRSEWGSEGSRPSESVDVAITDFLGNKGWLKDMAERHGVQVELSDDIRRLLVACNAERTLLSQTLRGIEPLSEEETTERLAGSRFQRELRPFQVRDLGKVLQLAHGANFSVPGAGKTTVAYATYEAERTAGRVRRLAVVAPLSAFDAWMTDAVTCLSPPPVISRFSGGIPDDTEVLLVNYQRLASNYTDIARWVTGEPTMVVLDEAHRMKRGWSGLWGAACLSLAMLAARRDILTGTPAPQGPLDLEALLEFVWPSQARRVVPAALLVTNPPPDAGHRIAQAISPLFVRTTKNELGLRPPDYDAIIVPLGDLHGAIYRSLLDQYAGAFRLDTYERINMQQMGQVVMYLLEAATNPALLVAGSSPHDPVEFRHPPLDIPPDSRLAELLVDYGRYETPAKFVELAKLIDRNARLGRKTLVWTNFIRNISTLERMLAAHNPAVIHGGIPSEITVPNAGRTREFELTKFRNDPSCLVLLANPAATSEGVSLHDACHDAVYLDRTFNAGQYLQSVDRIHRLGLPADAETRVTFLLTESTIDLRVDARVREKATRLGEMLDDHDIATMALPDDEDYGAAIDSQDDLVALFAHLRGDDAL